MYLQTLKIRKFRNITRADIACNQAINIITGVNGSGKTSVLEAISLLSYGRSFRSKLFDSVIQVEQEYLSVFARLNQENDEGLSGVTSLGVYLSKRRQKVMHLDRKKCLSAAMLARVLPVKVIASHCFSLLDQGPKERRKYFDWLTFYLRPDFAVLWRQYSRYLEQRNSLLKRHRIADAELYVWDKKLIELNLVLQQIREETFTQLLPVVLEMATVFGIDEQLSLQLFHGWPASKNLEDCFRESLDKDRFYGRTTQGAHRFDFIIRHGHLLARDKLSRGQKKVLIYLLHIAQVVLLERSYQIKCVFLLDDLMSELDDAFSRLMCQSLSELANQIFITTTDWQDLIRLNIFQTSNMKVFHVKHGEINE